MNTPQQKENAWKHVFPCNMATSNEAKTTDIFNRRHIIREQLAQVRNVHPFDIDLLPRSDTRVGEQPRNCIRSYHSGISYQHIANEFACPVYGLEIEIDRKTRREDPEKIYELLEQENGKFLNLVALERDGSLSDQGVEIITAPLSTFELRQRYSAIFNILTKLRQWGWLSHDDHKCGLHISTNRHSQYADELLENLIMTGKGKTFCKIFSRRTADQLSSYCSFDRRANERYRAINVLNAKRLELRFFRGTLNPTTFISCMELTFALREFSIVCEEDTHRPIPNHAKHTWTGFIQWVRNNQKRFQVLEKYCQASSHVELKTFFLPPAPKPRMRRTTEERIEFKKLKQIEKDKKILFKLRKEQLQISNLYGKVMIAIRNLRLDYNTFVNPMEVRSLPVYIKNTSYSHRGIRAKATFCIPVTVPTNIKCIVISYRSGGWGSGGVYTARFSDNDFLSMIALDGDYKRLLGLPNDPQMHDTYEEEIPF